MSELVLRASEGEGVYTWVCLQRCGVQSIPQTLTITINLETSILAHRIFEFIKPRMTLFY